MINAVLWLSIIIGMAAAGVNMQWYWFVVYGAVLITSSPFSLDPKAFFSGNLADTTVEEESQDKATEQPNRVRSFCMLGSSSFITWIFAKSIQNSAKLGGKYGLFGGLAYSTWYLSFLCVALVVYRLRKKGYTSLTQAINHKYGPLACISFCAALLFRLYQEVWSNAIVVAGFYGDNQSANWWGAVLLSVVIPALYVFNGGLRSSLLSDTWQAGLAILFLIVVLSVIGEKADSLDCGSRNYCNLFEWNPVPERKVFSLEGGLDLIIIGMLQGGLSYGFFDPVLTDRAFLSDPKTMRAAFISGGTVAALFIVLFSFIGVLGNMAYTLDPEVSEDETGLKAGDPATVARYVGTAFFTLVNIIFMTSSISTLDSTFSSTAKLLGPEFYGFITQGKPITPSKSTSFHVSLGRVAIVLVALAGAATLLDQSDELNATTISGTVVMGLGPPVLLLEFMKGYNPLAFHIPFWFGVCLGIVYSVASSHPTLISLDQFTVGDGSYGKLLGINLFGTIFGFALCGLFALDSHLLRKFRRSEGALFDEDNRLLEAEKIVEMKTEDDIEAIEN